MDVVKPLVHFTKISNGKKQADIGTSGCRFHCMIQPHPTLMDDEETKERKLTMIDEFT